MTRTKKVGETKNNAAVKSEKIKAKPTKKTNSAVQENSLSPKARASVLLRLPIETKDLAQRAATKSRRSLNQYLIYLIEKDNGAV